MGIDCVVGNESENVVGSLFEKAVDAKELPEVVHGDVVETEEIPLIKEATIDGIIEITRDVDAAATSVFPLFSATVASQ